LLRWAVLCHKKHTFLVFKSVGKCQSIAQVVARQNGGPQFIAWDSRRHALWTQAAAFARNATDLDFWTIKMTF